MADGIYIALSGATAQSDALEVVSNNAANVATNGFRPQKVTFGSALVAAGQGAGGVSDTAFVQVRGVAEDTRQGLLRTTNNPLDLALMGDGFFAIDTPRGPRYTRAGAFRIAEDGLVVDVQGNPARSQEGGPISIPQGTKTLEVLGDGTVVADGQELGTLELARFAPESLQREGATLYAALPAAKPVDGVPEVVAGALEYQNGIGQVVSLVKIQRTYEAMLSMIDSYKALDSRVAREMGKGR